MHWFLQLVTKAKAGQREARSSIWASRVGAGTQGRRDLDHLLAGSGLEQPCGKLEGGKRTTLVAMPEHSGSIRAPTLNRNGASKNGSHISKEKPSLLLHTHPLHFLPTAREQGLVTVNCLPKPQQTPQTIPFLHTSTPLKGQRPPIKGLTLHGHPLWSDL